MELTLKQISKFFTGVKALDSIDVHFRSGEVHALCGENGAGKSTLLNIITGNLQPDEGDILLDGKKIMFSSPQKAYDHGIAIVYQHLSLVDSLSIAENIYASFPPKNKFGFLQRKTLLENTRCLLSDLDLTDLKPHQLVKSLNPGQKQMVEIAKALSHHPRFLFLDEPTASISEKNVTVLFGIIRKLKEKGTAIIYISHRMKEISTIADRVTVLKDGKSQGTHEIDTVSNEKLIQMMVGRRIEKINKTNLNEKISLLEVDGFNGPGFSDINFTINKGEILGMAGLIGAGRTEIAKAIFGMNPVTSGRLKISGKTFEKFSHPYFAMQRGIAYITENRRTEGLFLDKSITDNIGVTELASQSSYQPTSLAGTAARYCKSLNIKTPHIEKKVGELSGGNQQKVLLAKWLHINAQIIILDEPTHGIDAGAKFEIYKIIQDLSNQGKALLLISSELPELLQLCHRIMIIREGKIIDIMEGDHATEENILSLAM